MAKLQLETNEYGVISGLRLDGVESMTSSDGSVTFYADKLTVKNRLTGEETEFKDRCFQDIDGTIPITKDGDKVGLILNRELPTVKDGYNFDDVSVSNVDVSKMKNLLK